MSRTTRLPVLALAAALAIGGIVAVDAGASHVDASTHHGSAGARATFHDAMRTLWEDHVLWTRQFIVSAATGPAELADLGPTVDRLLRNQADIGNAIKPFYGEDAGNRLTALLRDHILTAAELLAAAKAGDGTRVDDASARWYANADEIAAFLSAANPHSWPLADMRSMMRSHLDLTLKEALARLDGRYADDIAAYDAVQAEVLGMADMLSDGIVRQFPAHFRG